MKSILLNCLFLIITMSAVQAQTDASSLDPYANETEAERDTRMEWFRAAKFGMFIHWGVYAVPAGIYKGEKVGKYGEWIMSDGSIPMAEYQRFAKKFNPIKYDPEAWVKLAKEAGMKYIVITSKHHDGFALFDSKVSKWDIVDASPYGKDLIAPLAEACKKHGIKLGLYYSQAQDWNQGGSARGKDKKGKWDPAQEHDMDDYIKNIAVPQVKEILTQYQPAILWWDTPRGMNKERAEQFLPLLKLAPGIIHNNRLGGDYKGDISTPEQFIPGTGLSGDWESCMTMNNTWGYKSYDHNWKSTETLIQNLVDIASKGGNFLLNVGPTAEGLIPEPSVERLKNMGEWMKKNSESIYGTSASPCRTPAWGRITTRTKGENTTLYLNVFDWPKSGNLFLPVTNKVQSCYLLVDKANKLKTKTDEQGTTISLAGEAPDSISSVIVLKLKGKPIVSDADNIKPDDEGNILLPAQKSIINNVIGSHVIYNKETDCIEQWSNEKATVDWDFSVDKAGTYTISMHIASEEESALELMIGDQKIEFKIATTEGFKTFNVGEIELDKTGNYSIHLKPKHKEWKAVMLKGVTISPK
ncbi:alpha-L-fucosidase [Saccharicrinis fermentans]|uniref:alpha-L-fucosidase n=1 Tax=Saccharicrinis fermentans DSM 9555 = JCM 21142 TaxID=869213 RepID=W7Y8T3_9BACT|nr:alpha-L-fucosidase [Saccharicrinis fermentans]GAF04657.1 alpha-L-fucosidase [Saccharicrinis fermentans DSM 9555 = JCM 21142]